MTESNEYTVDKTGWPEGPWMDEPDKLVWIDETTDLDCMIVRAETTGALCGYVACPPGHPWHGKGCDDVPADVHGGLTYADSCRDVICHVPESGRPHDVWWVGFDCAHFSDRTPAMERGPFGRRPSLTGPEEWRDTYKDIAYVRAEVERLAQQVKEKAR